MNQDTLVEEARRVLAPLLPDEPVDLIFRHDYQPREGDRHYRSDGEPALEFYISPSNGTNHVVHVTRVNDFGAIDALPVMAVLDSDGLPDEVWVKDDPFRPDYDEHLPHSAQHYGLYSHICRKLQPATILEIGVRGGYSAWSMLQAVPDATYLGIDLNQGTWGGQIGYIDQAKDMLTRTYPQADITILEGDSQSINELPKRFDLIHVDGHHGYEQALHDLELCFPYADYIIVDDVDFATTVRMAVNEFLTRHPGIKAVHYQSWRGLVVMETRVANWKVDLPSLFESPDTVEDARHVILMHDGNVSTEDRWRAETPWLLERLVFPPGLLLDIGCGIGRLAGPLARRRNQTVLGIDSSAKMRGMALSEVDHPERFAVTTQPFLAQLVASGLRAQGALAIWVLQHMPVDQLTSLIPLLWQALEPGAALFTMDRDRCIPTSDANGWIGWCSDNYDMWALLEREGFMLHTTEPPPPEAGGDGAALRRWIRRR